MTHNEFAGYAQFSIMRKTTSNGLCAERNLNHMPSEGWQDRLYFEMKYYKKWQKSIWLQTSTTVPHRDKMQKRAMQDVAMLQKQWVCPLRESHLRFVCSTWSLSGEMNQKYHKLLDFDAFIQQHNLHVQHDRLILSDRKNIISNGWTNCQVIVCGLVILC